MESPGKAGGSFHRLKYRYRTGRSIAGGLSETEKDRFRCPIAGRI